MDFSKLTEGFGGLKDELSDEFQTLGSEVISGKTSPTDALHEGEETIMGKVKGFFGSDDKADNGSDDDSKDDDDNK